LSPGLRSAELAGTEPSTRGLGTAIAHDAVHRRPWDMPEDPLDWTALVTDQPAPQPIHPRTLPTISNAVMAAAIGLFTVLGLHAVLDQSGPAQPVSKAPAAANTSSAVNETTGSQPRRSVDLSPLVTTARPPASQRSVTTTKRPPSSRATVAAASLATGRQSDDGHHRDDGSASGIGPGHHHPSNDD
jgi:hypothetical protein